MTTALVLRPEGQMRLERRPSRPPAAGQVLVSVIATGICGSDVHGAAGDTGRRQPGQVMGHETVGRVRDLGPGVDSTWLGALVAIDPVVSCGVCEECSAGAPQHCVSGWVLGVRPDVDGAFATDVVVLERNLVRLPETMPEWHGAVIEPLAVGYHAVRRGGPTAHDRVLVIGGGPIGQAVALACGRVGVGTVLVSEPSPSRRSILESLGFACTAPDRLGDAVADLLGRGATFVFDAVGTRSTLASALRHSVPRATIVLVGMDSPELSFAAYEITARERAVIGTICSTRERFRETAQWATENPDVIEKLVDRRVPLGDGASVFRELMSGALSVNKVLLMPQSGSNGGPSHG